ncbi:DUF3592 domain-containing protein [Parafrankia elaeagni]|uniref:DUF3592 domain-containing protein n=1 Tax=Parafrankia elaeagni TaxID=222534 RepID=UPI0003A816E8|nr:DUF3592 domain-containing protein [Parafrankia elaeagni]
MSADNQGAATTGIGRRDRQQLPRRLTDADVITDRDGERRERTRVPERTVGALANNVAWLVGEAVVAAFVLVLVLAHAHAVREGSLVSLILAAAFVVVVRAGAEFREQVRVARHGLVVDGVVVRLSRLGFLDPGWKRVKVRFTTAQGATRSCWMTVRPAGVGERVTVRHDPWWPRRTAWGPAGGALLFLAVARLVLCCLVYFLIILGEIVAIDAMG